eukprot:5304595-Pleurochrysis_carterae.AAC.1
MYHAASMCLLPLRDPADYNDFEADARWSILQYRYIEDWLQLELRRTRKTSKSLGQRQLLTLALLRFYGSAKDFTSYTKAISGVL